MDSRCRASSKIMRFMPLARSSRSSLSSTSSASSDASRAAEPPSSSPYARVPDPAPPAPGSASRVPRRRCAPWADRSVHCVDCHTWNDVLARDSTFSARAGPSEGTGSGFWPSRVRRGDDAPARMPFRVGEPPMPYAVWPSDMMNLLTSLPSSSPSLSPPLRTFTLLSRPA